MSLQSPAPLPLGLNDGPPVSHLHEEAEAELRVASDAPPPPRPPIEAELVQQGKLSMGQLAQAHRDRLEKGGSVLDIIVERGWVDAGEIAVLKEKQAAAEAAAAAIPPRPPRIPETTTAPVPEAPPEPPAPAAEAPALVEAAPPAQTEPTAGAFQVAIRLTTGELVTAGEAADAEGAQALAQVVVADVATAEGESWPYVAGRYIRPETIVSVDILTTE